MRFSRGKRSVMQNLVSFLSSPGSCDPKNPRENGQFDFKNCATSKLTLRVTYLLPFALALAVCLISPISAFAQSAPADSAAVLALVEEQLVKVIGSAEQSVVALGIIKRGAEGAALRVDGFGLEVVPRAVDEHSPEHIPNEFGSGVIITVDYTDEATSERLVLTAYHL